MSRNPIRRARSDDAQGIHDAHMSSIVETCSKDYTPAQIEAWGRRPFNRARRLSDIEQDRVWVVEIGSQVEGFAHLAFREADHEKVALLSALYFTPRAQGRGWAKALMETILNECRTEGALRVELHSTLTSRGFYERLGFRRVAGVEFHEMRGEKIPCVPMELWLESEPPSVELCRPSAELRETFIEALRSELSEREKFSWIYTGVSESQIEADFAAYLSSLLRRESDPPEGLVADTVYWAVHENQVVGRISLRHELNDFLRREGGHVGYIVRPSFRGRGVAREMLRQLLLTPRSRALQQVLVTCDESNRSSIRVIERNRGILSASHQPDRGEKILHYTINTTRVPDLKTARLHLNRCLASDVEALFDYARDPKVVETVTWDAHKSLEDSRNFLALVNRRLSTRVDGGFFLIWAIRESSGGPMLGTITLAQYSEIGAEIGYALASSRWSKGYMSEAVQAVSRFAFDFIPSLLRVQARCLPHNTGSRRVLEKSGFELEGVIRSAMMIKGAAVDLASYSLLRAPPRPTKTGASK